MGHGIFPNYGMQYIKMWQHQLSKGEMQAVFYPDKNQLKSNKIRTSLDEQEENFATVKKNKK
jgi:hypothetical protein